MDRRVPGDNSSQPNIGRGQSLVSTQLLKVAINMRHIDELFLWLAQVIVQNFDAQVVQFWATQSTHSGQYFIQLRTMVSQDTSLPQHVVTNNQVIAVAERILTERSNYLLQPTGGIFPPYQASLLTRYGLNYFFSYFLGNNMLLPPPGEAPAENLPTPLALIVMLFLRQAPSQNLIASVRLSTEQALAVAGYRGLLLSPNGSPARLSAESNSASQQGRAAPRQNAPLPVGELILRRLDETNMLTTSSPFASTVVISDKSARRLFAAIDGHKNFDELRAGINMDSKEAYRALQLLLHLRRIELYEPGGGPVDGSLYFQNL